MWAWHDTTIVRFCPLIEMRWKTRFLRWLADTTRALGGRSLTVHVLSARAGQRNTILRRWESRPVGGDSGVDKRPGPLSLPRTSIFFGRSSCSLPEMEPASGRKDWPFFCVCMCVWTELVLRLPPPSSWQQLQMEITSWQQRQGAQRAVALDKPQDARIHPNATSSGPRPLQISETLGIWITWSSARDTFVARWIGRNRRNS